MFLTSETSLFKLENFDRLILVYNKISFKLILCTFILFMLHIDASLCKHVFSLLLFCLFLIV